jgi:hypothetical protein
MATYGKARGRGIAHLATLKLQPVEHNLHLVRYNDVSIQKFYSVDLYPGWIYVSGEICKRGPFLYQVVTNFALKW